jgi:hypothetical protein
MKIISRFLNKTEKVEYYFAIVPDDMERPFILGAQSVDPKLPSIAQWGASSRFGLDSLETIEGKLWKDWRFSLEMLGASWVIPIMEESVIKNDLTYAVNQIISKS